MTEAIEVVVNGEPRAVRAGGGGGATLLALLRELDLDPRTVVVEHNRRIVRRPALGEVTIAAGDAIELVHFVGGG
ncbi:MAG: sulfur carrier protein ThiS [Gemmatimonadales bacterium]|nr:sulfur carrier protein ThiS [Gemmatimonadales bacterium]